MLQHPLTGIDPAVVHMAVAMPSHAPIDLKEKIARAAKYVKQTPPRSSGKIYEIKFRKDNVDFCNWFGAKHGLNMLICYKIAISVPIRGKVKAYHFGGHCDFQVKGDSLNEIIREVAKKHKVTVNDIKSPRRSVPFVKARQEFYYEARNRTCHSLPVIAAFCGNRDHTTILHGIKKHAIGNNKPIPGAVA